MQHANAGYARSRPGGVVATMHMSGGQDNNNGTVTGGGLNASDVGMTDMKLNTNGRGTPGEACPEKNPKRQRSGDWTGVGQIRTEEGDFASACLADDVIDSVLDQDADW